ncbi:tyrosyl-tRNA synthetase [Panus rudis PR-1116 ss-1]|nr:tyrosyl-tRNA synthetase [Panus rudis PR-1116 ss-1]
MLSLALRRYQSRIRSRPVLDKFLHANSCHHSVYDELKYRGFISQTTSTEAKLRNVLQQSHVVYAGIDPTADYLHVGHLLPLLSLFHFHIRGHKVIPLIGGATGLVGDPSGRDTERPLSDAAKVEHNVDKLKEAVTSFFGRATEYARKRVRTIDVSASEPHIQSNLDWFKSMGLLEFLRVVGVHARVNTMLARESVSARLASQQGISFTEFTYQLLQAYDFYTLHKNSGCTIQIGGSDQWGNIVSGIDLINRIVPQVGPNGGHEEKVFGITTPLLTTASGAKFGKSAGNAVALNPDITSVFDFYQFFLRTTDADVGRYLRIFTILPLETIQDVLEKHKLSPDARVAQRLLASEVTELVHGQHAVHSAQMVTKVLYESDWTTVKANEVLDALRGDPRLHLLPESEVLSTPIVKLAAMCKLTASNSASRQLIAMKGLYLNNVPVADTRQTIRNTDLIDNRLVVLRSGSAKQIVLAIQ